MLRCFRIGQGCVREVKMKVLRQGDAGLSLIDHLKPTRIKVVIDALCSQQKPHPNSCICFYRVTIVDLCGSRKTEELAQISQKGSAAPMMVSK